MKFLVVLTIVAIVTGASAGVSKEARARFEELKKICQPESGITDEALNKLFVGDFSDQETNTKCFARCFAKTTGVFDKDDNLDLKTAIEVLGKDHGAENAEKWITPCKDIAHKEPCDKAFEIYKCFDGNHRIDHPNAATKAA